MRNFVATMGMKAAAVKHRMRARPISAMSLLVVGASRVIDQR